MRSSTDLQMVCDALLQSLSELQVPCTGSQINVIEFDEDVPRLHSHRLDRLTDFQPTDVEAALKILLPIWKNGCPAYRPDLIQEDTNHEGLLIQNAWTAPIRAVVDVPFSRGTLAVNSTVPNAFSLVDIEILEDMAAMLSETWRRLEDLKELERRGIETEILATAIRAITETTTEDDAFEILLQEGLKTVSGDRAVIFVYDEKERALLPRAQKGFSRDPFSKVRLLPGEGASGHVFLFGKSVLYDDRDHLFTFPVRPENRSLILASSDRAGGTGCVVPIRQGSRVVGTFWVSTWERSCTPRDLFLLEQLAAQAGWVIERHQTLWALKVSAVENTALTSAISSLVASSELGDVLQEIVQQVANLVQAEYATVFLFDEETGLLAPHAQIGHDWEVYRNVRLRPGEDNSGKAFVSGMPLLYRFEADELSEELSEENRHGVKTSMCLPGRTGAVVPLRVDNRVIGTISVSSSKHQCTERDLVILDQLGQVASQAIERARFHKNTEISLRQRSGRLELQQKVSQMNTPEDIVEVLELLKRVLTECEVSFIAYAINLVESSDLANAVVVNIHQPHGENVQTTLPETHWATPIILQAWRLGEVLYRKDLDQENIFGEHLDPIAPSSLRVRSVIDVPFSHGTFAVASSEPNAFSTIDVEFFQELAQILSSGYARLDDLQRISQAEGQMRRMQKLEAIGQLTAGIAHNFNNLLQGNLANISLAQMKGPPEVKQYLDDAAAAGLRGADLVRQLMAFSRAEADQLRPQRVSLQGVADNAVRFCKNVIDHTVTLHLEAVEGLPAVRGDASRLEQVLMNLLLNARDAVEKAGRMDPIIAIRLRPVVQCRPGEIGAGEYVRMEVQDNGTGMDQATQDRIFEPFFTTKDVGKGTGLGLATVYGIVQQHKGWIECQSQLGKGTTFSLFLPVWPEPEVQVMSREDQENPVEGTETLLIIDDEELVRRSTEALFTALGYQVLLAENGLEGLKLFRQERGRIGLILLDLSMPGLSGREVLRQIHAEDPQTKVIVLTGYATGPLEGASQVIGKPCSLKELASAVRELLDAPEAN